MGSSLVDRDINVRHETTKETNNPWIEIIRLKIHRHVVGVQPLLCLDQ